MTESEILAALPPESWLSSYVHWAMSRTDGHLIFQVGTGLSLLAQSIPELLGAEFGFTIYAHSYTMLHGSSTESRKTTAIKLGQNVLKAANPTAEGECPGSREGLIEQLSGHPRTLITYPEFGAFLAATDGSYLMPLKAAYTEIYDGGRLTRALVERKDRKKMAPVENPRLSLLVGTAPGFLEDHTQPVDWTEGFLARFLTLHAERERTMAMPDADPEGLAALAGGLRPLWDIETQWAPCRGVEPEARQAYDDFCSDTKRLAETSGLPKMIRPALARGHGMVWKIALALAWDLGYARTGEPWKMGLSEVEFAIKVVGHHNQSVIKIARGLASGVEMKQRRTVLANIPWHPVPSYIVLRESGVLKSRFSAVLDTLLAERTIITVTGPANEVHLVRTGEPPDGHELLDLEAYWLDRRAGSDTWTPPSTVTVGGQAPTVYTPGEDPEIEMAEGEKEEAFEC